MYGNDFVAYPLRMSKKPSPGPWAHGLSGPGTLESNLDEFEEEATDELKARLRALRAYFEASKNQPRVTQQVRIIPKFQQTQVETVSSDLSIQEIIEALEKREADLAERLVREHTLNLHAHVADTWVEEQENAA